MKFISKRCSDPREIPTSAESESPTFSRSRLVGAGRRVRPTCAGRSGLVKLFLGCWLPVHGKNVGARRAPHRHGCLLELPVVDPHDNRPWILVRVVTGRLVDRARTSAA